MTEPITTPDALDALPTRSRVGCKGIRTWERESDGMWRSPEDRDNPVSGVYLFRQHGGCPLMVLFRPDAATPTPAEPVHPAGCRGCPDCRGIVGFEGDPGMPTPAGDDQREALACPCRECFDHAALSRLAARPSVPTVTREQVAETVLRAEGKPVDLIRQVGGPAWQQALTTADELVALFRPDARRPAASFTPEQAYAAYRTAVLGTGPDDVDPWFRLPVRFLEALALEVSR